MLKNLFLPFLILTLSSIIGIYFRPLLIIDETRYISVAWEMWDKHSFLVPLINGEPYHHKPPLLFWLVHLDWFLFGVNEITVRFIPLLFSFGNLILTYKIYLQLWKEDIKGAKYSVLILSSMIIYTFFNSFFMFDILLTFWVLLGVLGIIKASQEQGIFPFILISLSIGFGVLSKGPVILVHILPLVLLVRFWSETKVDKHFYIRFGFAFLGGVAIALSWAVPAGIAGGEVYQNAIFWGQTANRMVQSFAHQRAFWWYLPILPFLLLPWIFYKPLFSNIKFFVKDWRFKILFIWGFGTVIIFSLISGKQIHYLLPEIPAFAILFGKVLNTKKESSLNKIAFSSVIFIFVIHFVLSDKLKEQDLSSFSQKIALLQQKGMLIAHKGKYNDQFHFLGRLHDKIIVINDKRPLNDLKKNNPNTLFITYCTKKDLQMINKDLIIAKTNFKNNYVVLIKLNQNYLGEY